MIQKSFAIKESSNDTLNFLSKTFALNEDETVNFIIDYIGQNWETVFKELNITLNKTTKQPINEIVQKMAEEAVKQILEEMMKPE